MAPSVMGRRPGPEPHLRGGRRMLPQNYGGHEVLSPRITKNPAGGVGWGAAPRLQPSGKPKPAQYGRRAADNQPKKPGGAVAQKDGAMHRPSRAAHAKAAENRGKNAVEKNAPPALRHQAKPKPQAKSKPKPKPKTIVERSIVEPQEDTSLDDTHERFLQELAKQMGKSETAVDVGPSASKRESDPGVPKRSSKSQKEESQAYVSKDILARALEPPSPVEEEEKDAVDNLKEAEVEAEAKALAYRRQLFQQIEQKKMQQRKDEEERKKEVAEDDFFKFDNNQRWREGRRGNDREIAAPAAPSPDIIDKFKAETREQDIIGGGGGGHDFWGKPKGQPKQVDDVVAKKRMEQVRIQEDLRRQIEEKQREKNRQRELEIEEDRRIEAKLSKEYERFKQEKQKDRETQIQIQRQQAEKLDHVESALEARKRRALEARLAMERDRAKGLEPRPLHDSDPEPVPPKRPPVHPKSHIPPQNPMTEGQDQIVPRSKVQRTPPTEVKTEEHDIPGLVPTPKDHAKYTLKYGEALVDDPPQRHRTSRSEQPMPTRAPHSDVTITKPDLPPVASGGFRDEKLDVILQRTKSITDNQCDYSDIRYELGLEIQRTRDDGLRLSKVNEALTAFPDEPQQSARSAPIDSRKKPDDAEDDQPQLKCHTKLIYDDGHVEIIRQTSNNAIAGAKADTEVGKKGKKKSKNKRK